MEDIKNSESYENLIKCSERLKNEQLRIELIDYYLKNIQKYKESYSRDSVKSLSIKLCKFLNEINTSEIEHYIEYCLLYHEESFEKFVYNVYTICMNYNVILKEMCKCYLRYSGKNIMQDAFDRILVRRFEDSEIQQLLEYVIEEEKKHILKCYELASVKKTYCESCVPYCQVKNEDGKTYKRISPFRY